MPRWRRRYPICQRRHRELIRLGCHHEEQHQELLLTDLLHLMSENPIEPAVWSGARKVPVAMPGPIGWIEHAGGIVEIGHHSPNFAFDCEGPRHQALLTPHAIADRTVTNGEWAAFIADGGYRDPQHWLSDGWAWVKAEGDRRAALLGKARRWLDPVRVRRPPRDRSRRARHACQLLRGGCLCQLGWCTFADRDGMGSRRRK